MATRGRREGEMYLFTVWSSYSAAALEHEDYEESDLRYSEWKRGAPSFEFLFVLVEIDSDLDGHGKGGGVDTRPRSESATSVSEEIEYESGGW